MFDWKNPDYLPIYEKRVAMLSKLRSNPLALAGARAYYQTHIADFISDWGVTVDPRVAGSGRSPVMPFVLFPKQREWIEFIVERWRKSEPGITEKSRDVGASWLAMATASSLCLFHKNLTIGFGSAKEDKVDRSGDPDSLFYKGRMFLQNLPREFRGGFELKRNSQHMRLSFPETESSIVGEAGDNIGRGGRSAIYFVDESAHLERPKLIDASLSANTDCRQDMSSVNGMANSFYEKASGGKIPKFTFHWRDDPRKDQAWYDMKCATLDPVIVAQEIDLNYSASVEGIVIPSQWVQASIGLAARLGISTTGIRLASFDVADRGMDKLAWVLRQGIEVVHAESWSGKGSDIFESVEKAFILCDQHKVTQCDYDEDGLGAGVRGDARKINDRRTLEQKSHAVVFNPFRGSGAVLDPERKVEGTERKNEDYYANRKAQAWFALRRRFQMAYRASIGLPYNAAEIISISPDFAERAALCAELSQPAWKANGAGKMLIDKAPEEARSPNLADSVMMAFAPRKLAMLISDEMVEASSRGTNPRPVR